MLDPLAQGLEQVGDAGGAVDHDIRRLGYLGRLRRSAAHLDSRDAVFPELIDGGESAQISQVITGVQDGLEAPVTHDGPEHVTLLHTRRPDLQHHLARLDPQVMPFRQFFDRSAERGQRQGRICRAPGVDGHRAALVLEPRSIVHARLPEQLRELPADLFDSLVRRSGNHGAGRRIPFLPAVMAIDGKVRNRQ